MKTDVLPLVVALTATSVVGTQISDAQSMILWLVTGASAGACTAICLPVGVDSDAQPHALKRKFVFSFLSGVGLTFCAFAYNHNWIPTADRVFAMAWLAATMAWVLVPVAMPIMRSMMRKWGAK